MSSSNVWSNPTSINKIFQLYFLILACDPDLQERLYDEVTSICDSFEAIDHENIKEMLLLEATILETQRLYPAVIG